MLFLATYIGLILDIPLVHLKDNTSVKTSGRCIAQLAKTSIDPKFDEFAADTLTMNNLSK